MTARRGSTSFWLAAAGILAADLVTKNIVHRSEAMHRGPIRVFGDWLVLNYIHNSGSAFGLFHGSRWFFIGVSAVSILLILSLALSGRHRDRWIHVAFGLILGGAIGNLLDRVWLGVVIDFLDLGIGSHRWPVFNVADIGVTAGVILLALRLLTEHRDARDETAVEATALEATALEPAALATPSPEPARREDAAPDALRGDAPGAPAGEAAPRLRGPSE